MTTDCNAALTVNSQSGLDDAAKDCLAPGSDEGGYDVKIHDAVNIVSYTDPTLTFSVPTPTSASSSSTSSATATSDPFAVPSNSFLVESLTISESDDLEKIIFGNTQQLMGLNNDRLKQINLLDLPELTSIAVSASSSAEGSGLGLYAMTMNLTMKNLPKLQSFFPPDSEGFATTTVIVNGTVEVENIARGITGGGDGGNWEERLFTVSIQSNSSDIAITNSGLTNVILDGATLMGSLNFSNPAIPTSPYNISLSAATDLTGLSVQNLLNITIPELARVSGDVAFDGGSVSSIDALKLVTVEGDFGVRNMRSLEEMSFGSLEKIGGSLEVRNNTALEGIVSSFPQLTIVEGSVNIEGNFSRLDLPSLTTVGTTMNISSTAELNCSTLDFLSRGVVQDSTKYSCTSSLSDKTTTTTDAETTSSIEIPTSTLSSSSSSSKTKPNTGAIIGGVLAVLLTSLAIAAYFVFRRWKRKMRKGQEKVIPSSGSGRGSVYYGRAELEQRSGPVSRMVEAPEEAQLQEAPPNDKVLHEMGVWQMKVEEPQELDGGGVVGFEMDAADERRAELEAEKRRPRNSREGRRSSGHSER